MRNNDEYNSIEIKNESSRGSIEFAKVQKAEFTSFNDNKNNPNRDELNPSTNRNNENVQKGENQTNNNDIIDKVFKQPMGVEEAASATSGVTASAASITTSASAATAASGTVAGTIVAATVVAVTAIGTSVGITAISNNNATVQFENIYIGETFMSYALELKDSNDTEFRLYVESPSYLAYNILQEGPNEGSFEMLQSNQTYRIYVQEQTDSRKIIYDSNFTTMADGTAQSRFDGIYFSDSANYLDYTFTVTLSYFDENEKFSDFILYMYDLEDPSKSKVFELEKTTQTQTLSGIGEDGSVLLDVRHSSFGYSLSYLDNNEEVMVESEDTIAFSDSTNSVSEVRGATISDYANFLTYTFGVTIDVQDDFDIISDFTLQMVNVPKTADDFIAEVVIPLLDTSEEQTIDYSEYNLETPEFIRSETFSFTLKWVEEGETKSLDLGTQNFNDSTNSKSEINSVFVDPEADLVANTFDVTVDYVDDFQELDNFVLMLVAGSDDSTQGELNIEIPLEKTTETQSILFSEYYPNDPALLRTATFYVYFEYTRNGMEDSLSFGSVTFVDKNGAKSEVSEASVSSSANFITYEFTVNMTFVDDYSELDNFSLSMVNKVEEPAFKVAVDIPLSKTATQTIDYSDYNSETPNVLRTDTFNFVLSWTRRGETESMNLDSVKFIDNSGTVPEISGANVASEANFIDYTFTIQLGYVDELDQISAFYLDLQEIDSNTSAPSGLHKAGGNASYSQRIELIKTTDIQTVDLDENGATPVDIRTKSISFTLVWVVDEQEYSQDLGSKQFTDNSGTIPEVSGATFGTANFLDLTFEITLQYEDVLNQLTNFVLEMTNGLDETVEIPLQVTTETQTVNYATYNDEHPTSLRTDTFTSFLKYKYQGQDEYLILELGSHQFEDEEGRSSTFDFNYVTVSSDANYADYTFTVILNYSDPYDEIDPDRCSIYIGDRDYPLELTLAPQTISAKDKDGEILLDLTSGQEYDWLFTYYDKSGNLGQIQSDGPVIFTDEDYEASFNGVTIDEFADFAQQEFYVTLDITDVFAEFSNFQLEMTPSEGNTNPVSSDPVTISLENTNKKQTVLASEQGINLASGEYSWQLTYDNIQKAETGIVGGSGTITFQNKYDSNFNALITNNYNVTIGPSQLTGEHILPFRLDYDNRGGYYHGMILSIDGTEFEVNETTSWQYIDITQLNDKIGTDVAIGVYTYYYDYETQSEEKQNLYSETVTLTLNEDPVVYGANMGETNEPAINLMLLVYDHSKETFDNYQLVLETSDGTEYYFDIDVSEISSLMGAEVSVNISNEEDLVEYLQNEGVVNIYLSYRTVSSQTTSRVTVQEKVSFYF